MSGRVRAAFDARFDEVDAGRAAAAVVDSRALAKLYTSPVTLARFEADAGTTNRGDVRMELSGVFGGEGTGAAVRIAAS